MSTLPVSDTTEDFRINDLAGKQVSLVVRLTATPSARLTCEINTLIGRKLNQPFAFLGNVGDTLKLDLHLKDPGLITTEALVKSLLKIKGVRKLKAERICPHRGAIYAISLKS